MKMTSLRDIESQKLKRLCEPERDKLCKTVRDIAGINIIQFLI